MLCSEGYLVMAKGSVRRLVPNSIPWNLWQLHGFNQQMRGGAACCHPLALLSMVLQNLMWKLTKH